MAKLEPVLLEFIDLDSACTLLQMIFVVPDQWRPLQYCGFIYEN
jgi:hypothetical protein